MSNTLCPKHWSKKEWWADCPSCPETVSASHFDGTGKLSTPKEDFHRPDCNAVASGEWDNVAICTCDTLVPDKTDDSLDIEKQFPPIIEILRKFIFDTDGSHCFYDEMAEASRSIEALIQAERIKTKREVLTALAEKSCHWGNGVKMVTIDQITELLAELDKEQTQ